MSNRDLRDALARLQSLAADLRAISGRDPEQEVQGIALPVLDAVIGLAREALPGDPVVSRIQEIISPGSVERGEPIRAVDALVVVNQLVAAIIGELPPEPKFASF